MTDIVGETKYYLLQYDKNKGVCQRAGSQFTQLTAKLWGLASQKGKTQEAA
jgi:hypothetical protein